MFNNQKRKYDIDEQYNPMYDDATFWQEVFAWEHFKYFVAGFLWTLAFGVLYALIFL